MICYLNPLRGVFMLLETIKSVLLRNRQLESASFCVLRVWRLFHFDKPCVVISCENSLFISVTDIDRDPFLDCIDLE